jgi:hypothetical protein
MQWKVWRVELLVMVMNQWYQDLVMTKKVDSRGGMKDKTTEERKSKNIGIGI